MWTASPAPAFYLAADADALGFGRRAFAAAVGAAEVVSLVAFAFLEAAVFVGVVGAVAGGGCAVATAVVADVTAVDASDVAAGAAVVFPTSSHVLSTAAASLLSVELVGNVATAAVAAIAAAAAAAAAADFAAAADVAAAAAAAADAAAAAAADVAVAAHEHSVPIAYLRSPALETQCAQKHEGGPMERWQRSKTDSVGAWKLANPPVAATRWL